jgi:hypothetical protein
VGVYGNGSLYLEMVILSAWRTGKGRVPDCTIVDGATSLMAMVLDFSSAPLQSAEIWTSISLQRYTPK